MPARANISPSYRWRLGLLGVVCLGIAAWAAYDGLINYPQANVHTQKMIDIKSQNKDPEVYKPLWKKYGQEHSIDTKDLEFYAENNKLRRNGFDIGLQYFIMAVTIPVGLIFITAYAKSFTRWVASDERGLSSSMGDHAEFEAITRLNKERWKSKGIAVVHYKKDGAERRLVLDDWKYEAPPTLVILKEVEAKVDRQVIEGDPEPTELQTTEPPPVESD